MFEKPKRKRSPKHRLNLPDWRWRLIILLALYGFIMLPVIATASEYKFTESLLPVGIAAIVSFGMGYVVGWYEKRIANPLSSLKYFLVSFGFLAFTLISIGLLIISYAIWLFFISYGFSSLNVFAITGVLLLPVLIAIHIGMAGEKLAIRNYQWHNQSKVKRKREYDSDERLSDEYDAGDDDSFDVIEQSESNEVQQKFDSLEE
jgi:hypothetical protein